MKDIIPVFIGGVIGTALRVGADTVFSLLVPQAYLSVMWINLIGSFMLGALVAGLWTRAKTPRWIKNGIGTGVLGAFTTLSGVMMLTLTAGNPFMSMWIMAISLLTSLFAAWFGLWLGGLTVRKRAR